MQQQKEGVVSMLIEDMAEQQLKEAVLAFTILYMAGDRGRDSGDSEAAGGLSQQELDQRCEDFLLEHFGLKVWAVAAEGGKRLLHAALQWVSFECR